MSSPHRRIEEQLPADRRLVNRYALGDQIGAGAYGMIFRAIDETTGEVVAVKAIPSEVREVSTTAAARFQREMKVIRALMHPNIITLYDWGRTDEGLVFMVLEYIEGRTLDDVVTGRPMDMETALDVTEQLLSALQRAHENGVIHRDLKPANVMLTPRREGGYRVKVLDFGMAKVVKPLEGESLVDLTREGMAVGTPRYIAPEQARGREVSPATDLYAVGLLIYEMFTGVQAVPAKTLGDAIAAHVSRAPLELAEIQKVPREVRPLLWSLVEKDDRQRIQGAQEVIREVRRLRGAGFGPQVPLSRGLMSDEESEGALRPVVTARTDRRRPAPTQGSAGGGLELDYEKIESAKPKKKEAPRPVVPREQIREDTLRVPETAGQWGEVVLAMVMVPLTFLFVGAQMSALDFFPRFLASSLAPLGAFFWATLRTSRSWSHGFVRHCWMWCGAAVVLSHLLGLESMALGLVQNPAWFLAPLSEVPGMGPVTTMVTRFARFWADLLQYLI